PGGRRDRGCDDMNRFALPIALFALLVVVLAIGIKHSPEKGIIASPLIGKPAPQFSLPSLTDGARTVSTTSLRGRWSLLTFWGTWCGTCREAHGMLLAVRPPGPV